MATRVWPVGGAPEDEFFYLDPHTLQPFIASRDVRLFPVRVRQPASVWTGAAVPRE